MILLAADSILNDLGPPKKVTEKKYTKALNSAAKIIVERSISELNQCESTGPKFREMLGIRGFYYTQQMFFISCMECDNLMFIGLCNK